MVSHSAKMQLMVFVVMSMCLSQRRGCKLVGVARSTARYRPKEDKDEEALVARIRELAYKHPRYGCSRMRALLARKGIKVGKNRMHRIWKEQSLQVPRKRRRKRSFSTGQAVSLKAEKPNEVWSYDFVADRTESGGRLKVLTIVDEHTRECLALRAGRWMTAARVKETLIELFADRGTPCAIRSDNGSEFTAREVRDWLNGLGCRTVYIDPGKPWQNGYCERFNGILRDECLKREVFRNEKEAQEILDNWLEEYNKVRPHSSLGYLTPVEYREAAVSSLRAAPCAHLQQNLTGREPVIPS